MAMGQDGGTHQLALIPSSSWLFALDELPLPARLVRRQMLVDSVRAALNAHGLGILTGSTGLGKTIIARFAAAQDGGNWRLVDLRDLSGTSVADRLTAVLASLSDIDAGDSFSTISRAGAMTLCVVCSHVSSVPSGVEASDA
jgi:hypothetical protein